MSRLEKVKLLLKHGKIDEQTDLKEGFDSENSFFWVRVVLPSA